MFGDRSDFPELLRTLVDYPISFSDFDDVDIEKEKLCSSQDVDGGGAVASSTDGGSRGGGSGGSGGVSASLTPAIWDKTIPTMERRSTWSTWTWTSSCWRMASP
ncbi:hypothetical protein FQA47_025434 [Oryzias melastigma]|uniref:Uncharacterized protein n=1 Tax=Oryzias melastigma TaxID=30732 RepID=A0A834BU58_ORYME|nr:hypothetical protein FQA47_025434 [Oryzias melastigma]